MKQKSSPETTNHKTIRSRLTGVVVVPSIVLLVMWAAFSSYTVFEGFYTRAVAVGVKDASIPAVNTFVAIQRERQFTMTALSESAPELSQLHSQQQRVDQAVLTMKAAFDAIASGAPAQVADHVARLNALLAELPQRRAQVESGKADRGETYRYYNSVIDAGTALFGTQARVVPDSEASQGGINATDLFRVADWMSRASSVASSALIAGEFSAQDHVEFANLVGYYHAALATTTPFAESDVQQRYQNLITSDAWKKLSGLEDDLINSPKAKPPLNEWQSASGSVSEQLVTLAVSQATSASDVGLANGNRTFITVVIGSLVALLVVLAGIFFAVRTSRRLVNEALLTRLAGLKNDSLKLAHERLPSIVERLRQGERVDVEAEVPPLDYGRDEIGQVADAFNAAQYTAVAAAVKESQAREGVNRVFLDIAHRNQGLVHRQLKILDKLEREEENPDQLDSLFQLDHLATRARRNAENLIVLAGEQPGRQWRKPVRLLDVLRAGVAETEQYVRVRVNPVPDTALVGAAVADAIHLIAELVDNATAFSSPRSQVQVHSSEVPQGVVVEIEDHGLGMSPEDRERANEMLAAPPEFDAMALKGESRLGLFVVARLAARRGIRVELRESPYGGTLALVLIPLEIIAGPTSAVDPTETTQLPLRTYHEQNHEHTEIPRQGEATDEAATFPEPAGTSQFTSGLDDFWAQVESAQAEPAQAEFGTPLDPEPTDTRVSGQFELPKRTREVDWPIHDPESTGGQGDQRPQLPRRRKQQNLAPQLATDEFVVPAEPAPEHDLEKSAERTRRGLSAFQAGTREARRTDGAGEP
ncbi:MAG TPA: nitrate- and nitrite sensing domain-containing protein [Pseudonocardiaceae bacterium]|nr:nitrate- and nitrite sensing domain-containing protein [Pseudonocardiaceae bacterium]